MSPPLSRKNLTGPPKGCGGDHEGEGDEVVADFLAAVRTHLESPAAATPAERDSLEDAARVLHRALEPDGEDAAVEALLGNPILLASFFQNADRLDTSQPSGARIARVILGALHAAAAREQA